MTVPYTMKTPLISRYYYCDVYLQYFGIYEFFNFLGHKMLMKSYIFKHGQIKCIAKI